jgi:hypothetical protein
MLVTDCGWRFWLVSGPGLLAKASWLGINAELGTEIGGVDCVCFCSNRCGRCVIDADHRDQQITSKYEDVKF